MKSWIVVTSMLLLTALATVASGSAKTAVALKIADKTTIYPKKVTSLKKRPIKSSAKLSAALSTSKNTLDAFKDLSDDDQEFIKQLDKQFKLHGDNVKIKVVHENVTTAGSEGTSKNSKRTVDGELSYGYYNPQEYNDGYQYTKPSFMFYPYSQEDIPASAPGYQPKYQKTTVMIQPSVSFELKHLPNGYDETPHIDLPSGYQQEHSDGGANPQQEPVILLRIPGSTKYASHLQVLLQQYLEIRAAQYLKILEEAEQQQQHSQAYGQPQQQLPEQHNQQEIDGGSNYIGYTNNQQTDTAAPNHHNNYPPIDEVYQSYKGRHQMQQQQQQQQHQEAVQEQLSEVEQQQQQPHYYEQSGHGHQLQQQYYYMPQHTAQEVAPISSQLGHSYQNVYYIAMPGHSTYDESHTSPQYAQHAYTQHNIDQSYADQSSNQAHGEQSLISENNPRNTHTKVFFTPNSEHNNDYSTMYPLPSIQPPFESHAPTATPIHEEYQQEEHQQQASQSEAQEINYHRRHKQNQQPQEHRTVSGDDSVVTITQRPYNYHAHSLKMRSRSAGVKRDASTGVNHMRKRRQFVNRKVNAMEGAQRNLKTEKVTRQ